MRVASKILWNDLSCLEEQSRELVMFYAARHKKRFDNYLSRMSLNVYTQTVEEYPLDNVNNYVSYWSRSSHSVDRFLYFLYDKKCSFCLYRNKIDLCSRRSKMLGAVFDLLKIFKKANSGKNGLPLFSSFWKDLFGSMKRFDALWTFSSSQTWSSKWSRLNTWLVSANAGSFCIFTALKKTSVISVHHFPPLASRGIKLVGDFY